MCLEKKSVPNVCLIGLPSLFLVHFSRRRSPMAGFSLRMVRCGMFRGALVWRFVLVGHARARMRWVGLSVRLVLLPCSLLVFFLFLPLFSSFSLSRPAFSASASDQPKPASIVLSTTLYSDCR